MLKPQLTRIPWFQDPHHLQLGKSWSWILSQSVKSVKSVVHLTSVFPQAAAFAWILTATVGPSAAAAPLSEGERIVCTHAILFTEPARAVPTSGMPDGPLLGNGDLGVVQAGPPEALAFYIGKNDFWGVKTQAPMAVGQLRLAIPALAGASNHPQQDLRMADTVQDLRLAELRGCYWNDGADLITRAWIDANHNLFCVELANTGRKPLSISVSTIKGCGGANTPSDVGASFLYDPDASVSGSRKLGLATRILGDASVRNFTLETGKAVTIVTAILTDLDVPGKDPLAEAKAMVDSLTFEKLAELTASHRQWWSAFWGRSFIEIPDKAIEQCWYSSWYIMASCSRAGKVAPGLWGNWITTDKPAWHGDFHLNYNFQAPFYGLYSSNHADTTLPFYDAMNQSIARGKRIARERGWQGIHLPVSIGPWGMCPEGDGTDWGQRSNAAYSALLFIWYWQHTRDVAWLKDTGYAFPRATAEFWENYLKFENDRYVIYNDSMHEGSGPDMNGLLSLGLVHTLFENIIPMSEALNVDADKRAKWRDICAKLSAFPTQQRDGNTVFRYSEKGMAWNDSNTLGIQHIFPAGAIGLDSAPKLLETSRNMIEAMGRWKDFNGSSSWYAACARVGYNPDAVLAEMRGMYERHAMPNKLLTFGGGGIENVSPSLAVTEMLLQSHDGVLRFFPCWPARLDARFGSLRAVGAFLVSAELKAGKISGVTIVSEKGEACTLVNPWPGHDVQVTRNGRAGGTLGGTRIFLTTSPGETLSLSPQ